MCGCDIGYVFNPISGLCEQTLELPFSHGDAPALVPAICALTENMQNGTVIYPNISPSQFPLTGQNTLSPSFLDAQSNTITPFSSILSGSLWLGGNVLTGLLNQRGVGLPSALNTWYGVNRCVTVAAGDVISFALSAKTAFRLYIDGVLAVIYQPNLPAKANTNLHVFPLVLPAGTHTFRAEGLSNTSYACQGSTHYGNFLVEIYRNVTPAILAAITTQAGLNPYYAPTNGSIPLLSPGAVFDVSSNNILANAYCTTGWLNACANNGGSYSCVVVNTLPFIPCCYVLTDCSTGNEILTITDLSGYIGHIIKIQEFPGCFIVSTNNDPDCQGSVGSVTVTTVYEDCRTCTQIYYKLTDCNGNADEIITITDLSGVVGSVIKLVGIDNICWIVTETGEVPFPVSIALGEDFASCEACLYVPPTPIPDPPFYQLSPVNLKTRSVQPGYDTEHCSSDFVEKVNCNFAQQVYAKLIEQKYGVESCIGDEYDKYFVKKQLLNLNLIYDPTLCKSVKCCAPCGISITIQEFNPITNTAPVFISADLEFTDPDLPSPSAPEADIVFQSPPTY